LAERYISIIINRI